MSARGLGGLSYIKIDLIFNLPPQNARINQKSR
jgi:hypothetical protein